MEYDDDFIIYENRLYAENADIYVGYVKKDGNYGFFTVTNK